MGSCRTALKPRRLLLNHQRARVDRKMNDYIAETRELWRRLCRVPDLAEVVSGY
jgi:hypothetical protein